jgi:maltose O-acetyltransferase
MVFKAVPRRVLLHIMRLYIVRKLLGNRGRIAAWRTAGCNIGPRTRVGPRVHMRCPENVSIGAETDVGGRTWIDAWEPVRIGSRCYFGDYVELLTGSHDVTSHDLAAKKSPIVIGDYAWLPRHVLVLPGVTMGRGAVAGTGSVVVHDVPPMTVVGGNPARTIGHRGDVELTYVPGRTVERTRRMPIRKLELTALHAFSSIAKTLPWGAGQYRVASPYAARNRWPEGFTAEQKMASGARLRLVLSDRTQLMAFLLGDYTPGMTQYASRRLPEGGTFFDVGGHVGIVSFTMAALRPDIAIHAFEPNSANAAGWKINHTLNPTDRARLTEKGLSDRTGELRFTLLSDSASGMFGEGGEWTLPVMTLDAYCEENGVRHIDVLKIDVQGHEPAVLRGAARMLSGGCVDTVICEIDATLLAMGGENADSIIEPLTAYGFRVSTLPADGLRGKLRGAARAAAIDDLVFERVA